MSVVNKAIPKLNKKLIRMVAQPRTMVFPPAHREFMALLNSNLDEITDSLNKKSDAVDKALYESLGKEKNIETSNLLMQLNKHCRRRKK
mmetsp:Transcript_5895/g.8088  ORF Transcript_5895/g.8088 Transcript_5895/m.8088 type:complete len:89 (+) Transcript_5895:49-315(+)